MHELPFEDPWLQSPVRPNVPALKEAIMKRIITVLVIGIATMLVMPALSAQEQKPEDKSELKDEFPPEIRGERGRAEFGYRYLWGDVHGRPDLPFFPDIRTSKLNEYSDIRRNFLVRSANVNLDAVLGNNYLKYETLRSFYNNQSHLATFGSYGRFKGQFRYEEIPHSYTNTARTLYTQTQPGVFTLPSAVRQGLQTASSTGTTAQINNALPSYIATQIVPAEQSIVPHLRRRAATGLFNYNWNSGWDVGLAYTRDTQKGTRPIGAILNSSPSAAGSSQPGTTANRQSPGSGVELPEAIDYVNHTVRTLSEYGKNNWALQFGYHGSYFKTDVRSMRFDAPFATQDIPVQIIPPGNGCTPSAPAVNCAISAVPAHGEMSTYPNNSANYLNLAGAFNAGKHLRVMGSGSNGWLRQNDAFLPYSANTAITALEPLPAPGLNGDKQTLAMNWTAVSKLTSNLNFEVKYRHYDYNNNTAVFELTPVHGDVIGANSTATAQATPEAVDTTGRSNPGYNRKTLELSGNYYLGKRSSARIGWESEWFDRSHRDVAHSVENTFFAALDLSPTRDLMFRISGRHQNREPEEYQDETAVDPVSGAEIGCTATSVAFTEEQRCHRRFDEAARILNRGDVMVQYDLGQFSFGGTFQTIQSDFNRPGGVNSPTPLNFVSGRTRPYYLYGFINDLSWIYTVDATYTFSPEVSGFAEYTRENYYKRMISRSRTPPSGTQTILTCNGCDTPNNDWESTTRDLFDTYTAGLDFFIGKRVWFSPYYSLSAAKGNVLSRPLGDSSVTSGPNQYLLTGGSTAEDYPQTTTRINEAAAVFKFKLTSNLMPKFEYRFQRFDNRDYQTSAMTPYMGCVGAGTVVVSSPCLNVGANLTIKSPSSYYPGFVVGDTAAARYLFLGADQPSYRSHIVIATVEYRF
jgi:hypothetical protein